MSTEKANAVRLSLIDVVYGVVIAYGFNFIDQASTPSHYFRFFFSYLIVTIDWIYVHNLYWGWEYKYNSFLVFDLGILFTISRLLHSSTAQDSHYLLFLAILFILYFGWDTFSRDKKMPTEYDWRYSLFGDLFAGITYLALWYLSLRGLIGNGLFLNLVIVVIYFIAFASWFKKSSKKI